MIARTSPRRHSGVYRALHGSAATDRSRTYTLIGRSDDRLLGTFELRHPEPNRLDCGYVVARFFLGALF
jgi:hypothetical protein